MSEEGELLGRGQYTIRRFEPRDRTGFLALYDRIYGGGDESWFAWKFQENPYLDETPIFLAETDGNIVGARPFLAFRMRVDDRRVVALQTSNTMVHPDHRRRGLFTRMTEMAFDHYADRDPAFSFNVPNAIARPGYRKLGYTPVADLTTYYRVQDPAAVADARGLLGAAARVSGPFVRGYFGFKDATAGTPPEISVTRHREFPIETLVSLYRNRPPEAIHAHRDEQFFEYRFRNPQWTYTVYTARADGTPVAGVVVGTRRADGHTATNITDVVPLTESPARDRGLSAIVARVLRDHADSDLIAARGPTIPGSILHRFGFRSDRALPLALASEPTVLLTCPLPVDGEWRIAGRDLREPSNWRPTFAEQEWT